MLLSIDNVALGEVVTSSTRSCSIIASSTFDDLSRVLQMVWGCGLLTVAASGCSHWANSVCAGPILLSVVMIFVRILAAYATS